MIYLCDCAVGQHQATLEVVLCRMRRGRWWFIVDGDQCFCPKVVGVANGISPGTVALVEKEAVANHAAAAKVIDPERRRFVALARALLNLGPPRARAG